MKIEKEGKARKMLNPEKMGGEGEEGNERGLEGWMRRRVWEFRKRWKGRKRGGEKVVWEE